jgi:hypothetical protein
VIWKDGEKLGIGMARETIGLDRRDRGRDTEHFRGLGKRHDIVLQNLPVDRLHAKGHLWLLVDEDDLAVVGRQ